jgi:uncharacterized protein YcfJ
MKLVRSTDALLLALTLLGLAGCRSPYYADRGAALGGVTGGLAGAALGDNSGNAVGGAVLGTAVGALTGAAIGDSMDAEVERRQAIAASHQQMVNAVTTADVMTMTASGLGEDVIVNNIRTNGVRGSLTPGDIIELHDNGVSEKVINAMQQQASRQTVPPAVVSGPPVIIEESYVVPSCWGPYRRYHHPRYYRRHPGVSWGFSYSH